MPQQPAEEVPPLELAQRVANRIRSRGARGIIGLARAFRIIDDNGNGQLDIQEFSKAMHDYRCSQDPAEIQAILDIFDADRSGHISYDEFLRTIQGEMNPRRRDLATQAFQKLDQDHDGRLDLTDIKILYNAKRHPDVMMGKKKEDDVLYEYLDTFE